jgi:antitoxin (DNA-binding transcriptional repressor) of toxin-antitoxin stability system
MWSWLRVVQLFRPDQAEQGGQAGQAGQAKPDRLAAYNTYDARNVLSQLIARTAGGEEIVIARAGVPVVKLVRYTGEPLRPGLVRTHVIVVPPPASEDGSD